MLKMAKWAAGASIATLIAMGCGGGGGGSSAGPTGNASVGLFIGDTFSSNYSQVWMTLYHVDASTDGLTWKPVFDSSSGMPMNLSALANSAQFMGAMQMPIGNYTKARIVMADHMKLVDAVGVTTNPPVGAPNGSAAGGKYTFMIDMPMSLHMGDMANMAIDFDLPNFQMIGGAVQIAVMQMSPDHFGSMTHQGWLHGTVSNLHPGVSFTLNMGMMQSITVTLSSSTTITSEATGQTVSLQNGQVVEVVGIVDPATHVLTATSIQVFDGTTGPIYVGCQGKIQSINAGALAFSMSPTSAMNFTPAGATVTVQTSSSTVFTKMMMMGSTSGSFSDMSMGEAVMVSGTYNSASGVISATQVRMF